MKIAMPLLSGINYGMATYFRNFIPALAKVDKTNEYHIFAPQNHFLANSVTQDNFYFHECLKNNRSALKRFLWEQLILPRELKRRKIDIVFTAKNVNIWLVSCKTVISIQNMEPFCYKNYRNNWKLDIASFARYILSKISMYKANGIIVPSEFTKQYIAENYPGTVNKLSIVYNGIRITKETKCSKAIPPSTQKYILTSSKYIAYANQLNLLEAYTILRDEKDSFPPLWMAGGIHDKTYFGKVKKLITEKELVEKIKMFGLLSYDELAKLYSNAFAFVFPSTLESCPQTLIEAMAFGIPIATSKLPPMPEICKDAAIYFDPHNKNDIADKLRLLITDSGLRKRLSQAAIKRAQYFEPEDIALSTVEVFKQVDSS